jgi:3-methyladenine DNA glycosylase Tag
MPFDLSPNPPRTVDGYLELIARVTFAVGMSWQSVEPRWPKIRSAFDRFSVRKVASYTEKDLARVLAAPGMIRNERKAAAIAASARRLARLRDEHGSVRRWLEGLDGFDEQQRALRTFDYVGPWGAYYVLSVAGFDVPPYETWRRENLKAG